jgi:acetoin utilization deacetylase AcuC-like enzyme
VGLTVNVPLEAGATDNDYHEVFDQMIIPVVRAFRPDLILVSAGLDAHERDPLGGMRLTTPAFGAMTMALRLTADECCDGRIVAVTEGGYDLRALRDSLLSVVDALGAEDSGAPAWPSSAVSSTRGAAGVAATRAALGRVR